MIQITNKDRFIFNLSNKVSDIIKEYHETGQVHIGTNREGLCLNSTDFYQVLDYVCGQWGIDKKLVTIHTSNIEESHPDYNIITYGNHWIPQTKIPLSFQLSPKTPQYTVGCFHGKPNWHRLVNSAWLYHNYKNKTLMTMHYDSTSERHQIDSELTDINRFAMNELESVVTFLPSCPIVLDEGFINYTIGAPTHYNIIEKYSNIFLDLVSETYITGLTFFPTEKTLRPIIAKTPFIIMGPCGYLGNMRRIGFKTFDSWWDEGYDNKSGYERILAIRKILSEIYKWDVPKMINTLDNMSDVLNHNRTLLSSINESAVKLNGK